MATNRTWPPDRPTSPWWKGVGESLVGPRGDLLYGSYLKTTRNFEVKSATTVGRRKGFLRGVDGILAGRSAAAYADDHSGRALIVVDQDGVWRITGITPQPGRNATIGHPGFPNDDFERAGGSDIADSTHPWLEGATSLVVPGRTAGSGLLIASNDLVCPTTSTNDTAEWDVEAPSPHYTVLIELDFSSLFSSAPANSTHTLRVAHGLQDDIWDDDGYRLAYRAHMIDAVEAFQATAGGTGLDYPWTGIVSVLQLINRPPNVTVTLKLAGFAATKNPLEVTYDPNDPFQVKGAVGYLVESTTTIPLATMASKPYIWEIRRPRRFSGTWWDVSELRSGKTMGEYRRDGGNAQRDLYVIRTSQREGRESDLQAGQHFYLDPEGRGGFFGLNAEANAGSGTSQINIPEIVSFPGEFSRSG